MTLYLHKEIVTDINDDTGEEETFYIITCRVEDGEDMSLPTTYTYDDTVLDADIEADVSADLADKGYTDLDPIVWE